MSKKTSTLKLFRHRYKIGGTVQGVGFRPFIHRLAEGIGLTGWVLNSPAGVELEVQGGIENLNLFGGRLLLELPPLALITSCQKDEIPTQEDNSFKILPSVGGTADVQVAPDAALCPECLTELLQPSDRRYRYPFITCTNCGPRYSIIKSVPYDRPNTTMAEFPLCRDCLSEYENSLDRRFHAQPLACPKCGPTLSLVDLNGVVVANGDKALQGALNLLLQGKIIAIKGVGGYHLAVDPTNHAAVERLRFRKKRDEKPFAMMVANLQVAEKIAKLNQMERRLLTSAEAPVVIVRKREPHRFSDLVAPGNGWLGIMLPYTPLHHLLFASGFSALVMTSANSSNEPIVCDDKEAMEQLTGICDAILMHNRPIHNRSDDSVLRVFRGEPIFYRRGRGFAPRSIKLPFETEPTLAVGAELKNTICLTAGNRATLSPHIGDLQNDSTLSLFEDTIDRFSNLLQIKPQVVACDLHPDYLSSVYAEKRGLPVVKVQHHHAHLAACMAENLILGDVIGLIFDGTGYGNDGTLWGGEILVGGYGNFERVGHFRQVQLPGGDAATLQPWRMALSYLYQQIGNDAFTIDHPIVRSLKEGERNLLAVMLERGINSPLSSSCGRLFDAVAGMLSLRSNISYDGQAAIELESLAENAKDFETTPYRYKVIETKPFQIDFAPIFTEIVAELKKGVEPAHIALRFHTTVASAATEGALFAAKLHKINRVVLSGGVFQNRLLTEMMYNNFESTGLQLFSHRLTPPNDGCIPLGQAAVVQFRK